MMKLLCYLMIILSMFLLSCYKETERSIITKWMRKEIVFPDNVTFTTFARDTVNMNLYAHNYKILLYVDSIGCSSCKFKLLKWKSLMKSIDSISNNSVSYLFFIHPSKENEMNRLLVEDDFDLPICIDTKDSLNKLNRFPSNMNFQTFLLDKDNRVLVIGNPVNNPNIKNLYIKKITGKKTGKKITTTAVAQQTIIDMGTFSKSEKRKAVFIIENAGKNPLAIADVNITCGCTSVDFEHKPALPGRTLNVTIVMTPKKTGLFNETATVYCNTERPIVLSIKGFAE